MTYLLAWSSWSIILGLLSLMFLANELGFRLGRGRSREEPESSRAVSNSLKASIFGLVAFLLAFAFSITSGRHDVRRKVVLDEANAIGTCYLRADLLAPSDRDRIRETLRRHVKVRLEHFDLGADPAEFARTSAEMDRLLAELWTTVSAAVSHDLQRGLASQIIPATNEVIDLDTTREWAVGGHLQTLVFVVLAVSVVVSSLLAGHSSGEAKRRHWWLWGAFNLLFGLVLFVVLDFDRPRRGFIQLDHAPLRQLRQSIGDPTGE